MYEDEFELTFQVPEEESAPEPLAAPAAKPAAPVFLQKDLLDAGLIGQADSAARREKLGKILGIGYGNGKVMLQRLNSFGIERDAFEQAVQEL